MQLIADLFNCANLGAANDALIANLPDTERRPNEEPFNMAHAALHTWPDTKTVWAEVFSPYDFDAVATVSYLMEQLQPEAVDYQVIERGWMITKPRGVIPVAPWLRTAPPPPEPEEPQS